MGMENRLDDNMELFSGGQRQALTLLMTVIVSVGENIAALVLALALDKVRWLKSFFRSIFYVPVLISGVVSGFIWLTMYNWNFGVINRAPTSRLK